MLKFLDSFFRLRHLFTGETLLTSIASYPSFDEALSQFDPLSNLLWFENPWYLAWSLGKSFTQSSAFMLFISSMGIFPFRRSTTTIIYLTSLFNFAGRSVIKSIANSLFNRSSTGNERDNPILRSLQRWLRPHTSQFRQNLLTPLKITSRKNFT